MKSGNFSPEWASLDDTERSVISKYHQTAPIQVGKIAKELGASVKSATLKAGISGEIKEADGQILIRINRHDSKPRQRFTLAHEIGHMLLHRDRIGDGIVDDILYRSSLSDTLEAQANRLAADILMPYPLIMEKLHEYEDIVDEERKYESVARDLEVSTTALKIRLGKL
tara:strand:+ start:826 stop:1332 length:507 start_codon:yes stop_codon:yes gene_type:complete